ncbi:unnamed protein product [Orchesella dallaii]|uniref:G-protein coupled receptors family 1 profile domain-containing protein n=1 Tax=Orchesella dallaii TaxID=48710 RepID=A0ABP1QUW8_9HEXA
MWMNTRGIRQNAGVSWNAEDSTLQKSSNGGLQQSLVVKNKRETVCENSDRPTRPSFLYPYWDLTLKMNAASKDISSTPSEKSSKVAQKTRRSQRVRNAIEKENQLARLKEENRRRKKELEMEFENHMEMLRLKDEADRLEFERNMEELDKKIADALRKREIRRQKKIFEETACMIDHHAAPEEGVNAPAICQPLVNEPKFLQNIKITRTDQDDEKKTDEPIEDPIEEQNPCIVRNPEEVYLSQEENILCHDEKLKNGAIMPLQSMEGAGEVDKGLKMSVQGRFAQEKKKPHRRKIDFNRKKWKEDLPKLRFLWRGEDGSRSTEMRSWIYFEMSINVQRNIPWRPRRWTEDLRSDDAGAVVVRKYEETEDNCNSMIPCSDVMDRMVQMEDFSSDSELKMKNGFRSSPDVLKVEGSVKVPGLASKELRARKKITEVGRIAVMNSPVISSDSRRQLTSNKMKEAVNKIRTDSDVTFSVKTMRMKTLLVMWSQDVTHRMAEKRLSILEQIGCIRNVQAPGKSGPLIKSNEDVGLPVFCDENKQPWSLPENCRITGRGDEVMVNIVIKFTVYCSLLFVLLFCLLPNLVSNIFIPWVLGWFLCKTVPYIQGVSVCASIYFLVAISVERCISIQWPLNYQITKERAKLVILAIWMWSCIVALPWSIFFQSGAFDPDNPSLEFCIEIWPDSYEHWSTYYFLFGNFFICYVFPLTIILVCYLTIWFRVYRRPVPSDSYHKAMEIIHQRSKTAVIKMLIVVVLIFALSWLPLYAIIIRVKFGSEPSELETLVISIVYPVAQWLGCFNSCINPIIYSFLNTKFRRAFLSIIVGEEKKNKIKIKHKSPTVNILLKRFSTYRVKTTKTNIDEDSSDSI